MSKLITEVCDTAEKILHGGRSHLYMKSRNPGPIPDPCTDSAIPHYYQKPHTDEKSINLNHQPTEAVHGAIQKVL